MSNEQGITLVEAVNLAIAHEMRRDPNVIVYGEDVGVNGGVFRATQNLQTEFGAERVIDTPLAESMLAGLAVGMSSQGLKPVVEFQFMGFSYPALDQIINHVTRMRNRTRGRITCPVVFRTPYGVGIHSPEHHSESTEAIYAHIPGIRVVIPASPVRAYGLLLAAIRNPDPVIFLEPARLYRKIKQVVPDNGEALPLDTCFMLQEGNDVTLITWGAMTIETLAAAEELAKQGITCDVIDVATISPLDIEPILASVEKTGRAVIVHEAARTCGVGAEISAQIMEYAWSALKAPVQRVTGYDIIIPLYRLEEHYWPSVKRVVDAVQLTLNY
jgi:2-oxoisovalerate dehydrogenase E1 component beta subunit